MAVKNADILAALADLGFDPGPVNATGAQSSAFKARVLAALQGRVPEQKEGEGFNTAKERLWEQAMALASYVPTGNPVADYEKLLRAGGIDDDTRSKITSRAREIAQSTPGLRAAGKSLGELDYAAAVAEVLGKDSPIGASAARRANVQGLPQGLFVPKAGVAPPPTVAPVPAAAAPRGKGFITKAQQAAKRVATPNMVSVDPLAGPMPTDPAGIMNVQRLLNERGANLTVDGKNGPATKAAHAKYGHGTNVTTTPPAPMAPLSGETLAGPPTGGPPAAPGAPAVATGPPPLPANATDAEVEGYIRRNFGFAAWALKVPEIRNVLVGFTKKMRGQDWSEDQLEAELMTSPWWQEHNNTSRARVVEKNEDPATYNQGINGEMDSLREIALQYGVTVSDTRLREIAGQGYQLGWTASERNAAIGAEFDYNPDTGANSASIVAGTLKERGRQYLLPLSAATIDRWGENIIAGRATNETFDAYAREQAKTLFPQFAKQLEAGMTVEDLVNPYREQAAKYLEMDGESIDFTDPKWLRALEKVDKDGNRTVSGLADFADTIRTDASFGWDKTRNAREHAAKLAEDLAKTFGGV